MGLWDYPSLGRRQDLLYDIICQQGAQLYLRESLCKHLGIRLMIDQPLMQVSMNSNNGRRLDAVSGAWGVSFHLHVKNNHQGQNIS